MTFADRKSPIKSFSLTLEATSSEEQQSNSEAEGASERPVSDEHEPSAPMATPMPSTFAGKLQQVQGKSLSNDETIL